MKNILALAAMTALVFARTARAEDQYILKTITCPSQVSVKLDMVNHIGSDPTFSVVGPNYSDSPRLRNMSQVDQKITCWYRSDAGINGTYSYTVKRKIISCNKKNPAQLECKIEP